MIYPIYVTCKVFGAVHRRHGSARGTQLIVAYPKRSPGAVTRRTASSVRKWIVIQRAEKVASGRSLGYVTRDQRRASAPTRLRARAARSPPSLHLCGPRFSRASLCRRDAAPFSRARGRRRRRARTPGSSAINATVVNERRPRPGGWRPLIGRADDDRTGAAARPRRSLCSVEDVAFSARRHYRVRNLCSFISSSRTYSVVHRCSVNIFPNVL